MLVLFAFATTGCSAIQLYSNSIFMKEVDLKTATIFSNVLFICQIIGTILFLLQADKTGRKDLLGESFLQLCVCLGLFSLCSLLGFLHGQVLMMWIILLIWGRVSSLKWMVMADYLPAKGMGLVNVITGLGRYIQGIFIAFGMSSSIGIPGTFGILGICQLLSYLAFRKVFIECKNSSQIDLWRRLGVKI